MSAATSVTPVVEIEVKVTGFYKLRDKLEALSHRGYYRGIFRDYIKNLLRGGTRHATLITHKETGWLAKSHTWEYDSHLMKGSIYVSGRNVYATGSTLRWPRRYSVYEHARGGSHAFYARTYEEYIAPKAYQGLRVLIKEFDQLWRA